MRKQGIINLQSMPAAEVEKGGITKHAKGRDKRRDIRNIPRD